MRKILVVSLALGAGCSLLASAAQGGDAPATQAAATQAAIGGPAADVQQAIDQALAKYLVGSPQRYKALEAAMGDWVKASPLAAIEWAEKQPWDNGQRHDLRLTVVRLWDRYDFTGLSDYLTHLPNNKGYGSLGLVLAARDPVAASAWAAKQSKDKWPAVINIVAEVWANRDPEAAAAWIMTLPPEQGCYGYSMTAGMWGFKDPHAAAAWVEKLPEGDARTDAVARLAIVWLRRLPPELDKVKEWVGKMPIPEARKKTVFEELAKKAAELKK